MRIDISWKIVLFSYNKIHLSHFTSICVRTTAICIWWKSTKSAFFGLPSTGLLYSKEILSAMEIQGFLNVFILVIPKTVAHKFQSSREHFRYAFLEFSLANSHWNIFQLSCSYRIYPGKNIGRWETSHNCCKEWLNFLWAMILSQFNLIRFIVLGVYVTNFRTTRFKIAIW